MKLIKKILLVMLVLVMSLGAFVSCGEESTADEKIVITVSVNGEDTAERDLMIKWKTAYEAINPNVTINVKTFTRDYSTTMKSYLLSSSQMPDIMWTTGEKHAPWSDAGVFVNLKDIDPNMDTSDFYDEIIRATHKNSQDNGIYFMPRDYNKCVLYINKVVFKAAGFTEEEIDSLKDGWDYDKFIQTCERLKVAMQNNANPALGVRANAVPLDARMDFNAVYCSFIKHYGGEFVVDKAVNLLSEENLTAYGKIYELIKNGYIAEASRVSSTSFTTLSAAMQISVRPSLPSVPTGANYDIDFLPLPLDFVGVGCSGYAITSEAQKKVSNSSLNEGGKNNAHYAYEFLQYIVSEAGQRVGAQMGSIIPVRKSMKDDTSWTTYMDASLNHSAFVSAPEKDFSLNIYEDFEADDASTIMDNMSKVMAQVLVAQNFSDNYLITGYKAFINETQKYQNKVAEIRAKY